MGSYRTPTPDLSKIPLAPNPSGAPPNFVNPPNLITGSFATGVSLIVVCFVLLAFRLGTNLKVSGKLFLDDILCIIGYAGGILYWALDHISAIHGTARHTWDIPLSLVTVGNMQRQTASLFVVAISMWAAKAAVLALYIRHFGTVSWIRRTSWFWIVFMAIIYALNIVAAGVYCVPRKGERWGGGEFFSRCSRSTWIYLVVGVFSFIADVLILVLPFPIIIKLRISLVKKITLGMVFGTGIILVAVSIVSLWLRVLIFQRRDPTWNSMLLEIVTVTEIFGTIAVSCTPAIPVFWSKIFAKSSLWAGLKSSSVASFLMLRISASKQKSQERPSFVATTQASSSKPPHETANPRDDSTYIVKDISFQVSRDEASQKSAHHECRV